MDWLPEIGLLPDHAPEATQELALFDDQVSMEDTPLAMDAGFAASDTAGGGGAALPQLAGADPD